MAYTKTNWVNGETPINATNLNKIEQGIADLDDATSGSWINLSYMNTYASYDENYYNPLQYKKIGNQVYLRGMIYNSVANPSGYYASCTTLPSEVRPLKSVYGVVSQGDGDIPFIQVSINSNGQVWVFNTVANTWLSLDNIRFFLD